MVQVCDGSELPKGDKSKVYLLRSYGDTAHEIWDVADPAKPALLTTVVAKLKGTHKSWWECDTGIAFLVSGVEGWLDRRQTQSRLFRLWCKQPRRPADRRPRKAPERPERAHAREPRLSAGLAARFPAAIRRAHDVSRSGHGDRGIRQGQGRAQAGFRRRDRRNLPQRVPGGAPDGHLRRRHRRDSAGRRVELGRAREKRRLLQPRRALRHALLERELRSRVLQAHHVLCALQRRGARTRHPRSFPSEGDRLLCSRRHGKDREALRRQGAEERCKIAIQTNNVEVDERGYIYAVDRANTGMHILRLTGA